MISDDCSSGIHDFCTPCECECHKEAAKKNPLQKELLDLITLMPDSQTQEIVDYIMGLRDTRRKHANPHSDQLRIRDSDPRPHRTNSNSE